MAAATMDNALATAPEPALAHHDLAPLAWVLDELRKALESSVKQLRRFVRESDAARESDLAALDGAPLRAARQQLHQAGGALQMIGMQPPALLLSAMEAAVQRFVLKPELCTREAAALLERASFALIEYLQKVLAGKSAPAVGLFAQYRDVLALAGDASAHPSDLWEHDQPLRNVELPGVQPLVYGPEARTLLDRAVLRLVKNAQDAQAARDLVQASLGFASAQAEPGARAFWQASAGFFDALAHGLLAPDVYVKRMASRVLLQYAAFAKGGAEVADRLVQDLLFFCAQAGDAAAAPVLQAVRRAAGLEQAQPVAYGQPLYGLFDPAVLVQARKRIAVATDTWSALSGGDAHKLKAAADHFSLVCDSLRKLHPGSEPLAQALTQAVEATLRSGQPPDAALAMEVATAVLYLQAAFEELDAAQQHMDARATHLAQRLQGVIAGGEPEPLQPWMEELYRRVSDHQTMGSVVGELRATLAEAEKSMDQYFRDHSDMVALSSVPGSLQQMRGVLSVLGMDEASRAVVGMRETVERLLGAEVSEQEQPRVFEQLGGNLGALGFLIDMLSYQRAMARKLFAYDEASGELRSLMGRSSAPAVVPAAPAAMPEAAAALPGLPATDAGAPATPPASAHEEEDDGEEELLDIFLEEAREVVANGLAAADALQREAADLSEQTTLRRAFHTLKGSSRMVGLAAFGDAAWAMEQVLNAWLAEQKPIHAPLLELSRQALAAFGRWGQAIADGDATAWQAQPFIDAAQAMRSEGRLVALAVPGQEQELVQPVPSEREEPAPPAVQDEPAEALDAGLPALDADLDDDAFALPDFADTTIDEVRPIDDAALQAFELAPDAPELAQFDFAAFADAAASPAAEPEEPAEDLLDGPSEDVVDAEAGSASVMDLAQDEPPAEEGAPPPHEAASEGHQHPDEGQAGGRDEEDDAAEITDAAAQAESPQRPSARIIELHPPVLPEEEAVKLIGSLRIPLPLFNVYLNEADEWSRRLVTALQEWALELHRPVPDDAIAFAHALAGSSATVGFDVLSRLARLLEHTLQHVQPQVSGTPAQAQVFSAAADEIRRLLHQFAAGFLKDADARIGQQLQQVLDAEVLGALGSPAPADAQALADADIDADADADFVDAALAQGGPERSTADAAPAEDAAALQARLAREQEVDARIAAAAASHLVHEDDIDLLDVIDPDLFPIFEEEALELLPATAAALRQWARRIGDTAARSSLLRALHTLKGSARLAGAMRLGEMAHRLESAVERIDLDSASERDVEPLLVHLDDLQANFDALRTIGAQPLSEAVTVAPAPDGVPAASAPVPVPAPAAAPLHGGGPMVRVRAQLLDRLVGEAGEVMIARSRLDARMGQLRGSLADLTGNLDRLRQQLRDIEVQSESQMQSRLALSKDTAAGFDPLEFDRFTRVQELTRMMAESVNDIATVQRNMQRVMAGAEDDLVAQARQARELQRDLLRTRMVEFESIAERLYAVVRQVSKETGKSIKLDIEGGSIEMDRGVLERMAPAFEHLLRNCADHGIEMPEQRAAAGKSAAGTIHIALRQEGNDVAVQFSDDGAGLDLERIRAKAVERGLLAPDAQLDADQAFELIFSPGFSTASALTGLSGRGIGMDVVRTEVNALGGRIETQSTPGQGTSFRLVLPLTTAVTQVVMLRAGERTFGVPASLIEIVRRVPLAALEQAYAQQQFDEGGTPLALYWAGALLQASGASQEAGAAKTRPVVIVRSAQQRLALHVDEVLGNQEVVVKNLGPQLSRLPGLAGMSVLASGAVVLIYNPVALATVYGEQARALMQQAGADTAQPQAPSTGADGAASQVPLVLVVDDSITVRRVTQRMLRREGYRVALANDGLQALEQLQHERPALVLSDIEMPRMDGFDLLRQIRGHAQWADLPVVMITSRIAQKHRDLALELGANHYLGKPYSDDELLGLAQLYTQASAVPA
ncbi:Hpt domain-containing protein [Comamonadaceae bacterium CD01]